MNKPFDKELHKRNMIQILSSLVKILSVKIAFKGGTCAYLFYNLPRFSFDLDFDVLSKLNNKDYDSIRSILQKNGRIRDEMDKKFTYLIEFDYEKGSPNIKLEFNKRLWENSGYAYKTLLGLQLQVTDESSLLTNKLVAMLERRVPVARDLFDVNYFLQAGYRINENLILERTGKTTRPFVKEASGFIEKTFTQKNILQGLGEAIDETQKKWVKKYLVEDTIARLKFENVISN